MSNFADHPNSFEDAVQAGDAGLIGMDGSGNDWEFSQNIGAADLYDVKPQEVEDEQS